MTTSMRSASSRDTKAAMSKWSAILLLLSVQTLGCAVNDAAMADQLMCDAARQHVSDCLGVEVAETPCNPSESAALLNEECSALGDDKTDRAASLLCRIGIYSACSVPACRVRAPESTCTAYIDHEDCSQCDYYLCREGSAATACGETGYYQGFGYAYCRRYMDVTTPHMTPRGQAFMRDVRRCLMDAMERDIAPTLSCTEVRDLAFASHQQCYLDSGFCALGVADRARILASVQPADLDYRLMLRTAADCIGR
jgi:hypothetical protein